MFCIWILANCLEKIYKPISHCVLPIHSSEWPEFLEMMSVACVWHILTVQILLFGNVSQYIFNKWYGNFSSYTANICGFFIFCDKFTYRQSVCVFQFTLWLPEDTYVLVPNAWVNRYTWLTMSTHSQMNIYYTRHRAKHFQGIQKKYDIRKVKTKHNLNFAVAGTKATVSSTPFGIHGIRGSIEIDPSSSLK